MTEPTIPTTRPTPIPLFFCKGEDCDGWPYKASQKRHPVHCLSVEQYARRDFGASVRDDNRTPTPSPLASILRIAEELLAMTDALEAAE